MMQGEAIPEEKSASLKEKILNEMTVDYKNTIEKNFELAKKLLRITTEGNVVILDKEKFNGREQILLYLIGKFYAREAGLANTAAVTNKELMNELSMKLGSVLPWTKDLRDSGKIKQIQPGVHQIPTNLIETTLKELHNKLHSQKPGDNKNVSNNI